MEQYTAGRESAMNILVTGAAVSIGFHLSRRLTERSGAVVGINNLNPYYDAPLRYERLEQLSPYPTFSLQKLDIAAREAVAATAPDVVVPWRRKPGCVTL